MEYPSETAVTGAVTARVKQLRTDVRLSGAALADGMAKLGFRWNQSTVAKLESGRRRLISVDELLALAQVLGIPPVLLLADPRRDVGPIPISEGVELSAWEVLLWAIGSGTVGRGIGSDRRTSVAMDIIWHGRVVAEAAGAIEATRPLDVYRPGTQVRGDALTRDGRELGTLDDLHRGHLETIAAALEHIVEELGAPAPQLGPTVLKRAAELGVELPGQNGEG